MAPQELSPTQAHALLDILSHHELYAEIQDFRLPGSLDHYGPPFQATKGSPSQTPSLQALVSKFVLHLPGLRDVDGAFWKQRVAALINGLEEAYLSESYDKGFIGIRRTLATAISALIEYPARGIFAGFDEPSEEDLSRKYDTSKSEDIQRAFRDLMHQIVYGGMIDEMVEKVGETDKLSEHTQLVQAAHEYVIVKLELTLTSERASLASFMHYTLIISPKGQNLLTLIEHANKLVPYGVMKQTLRIGNVATMMNAMVKVVLAKMSMGSMTNWIGWTAGADEGMNLMQHIIAQVLQWDNRDFKHRASKIEKDKHATKKEQLEALKEYISKSRNERQEIIEDSREKSKPIVIAILERSTTSPELTVEQHKEAQDYLALQLAIRDRDQIIKVMCHSTPDHLTQAVRDLVQTYDPLIRQTHNAVDLSSTLGDFEVFLRDLIKLGKVLDDRGRSLQKSLEPPTVGDFVQLLKKHQSCSHRFLHQVVKNSPEITSWFRDYALQAASNFRRTHTSGDNPSSSSGDEKNAGDLTGALNAIFAKVEDGKKAKYLESLDKHEQYLNSLHLASARRLHSVLATLPSKHGIFSKHSLSGTSASQPGSRSSSPAPASSTAGLDANPGPGAFLAKWQALIDNSEITPSYASHKIRTGASGSVLKASRVGADSGTGDEENAAADQKDEGRTMAEDDSGDEDVFEEAHERMDQFGLSDKEKVTPPDVRQLVKALLPGFKEVLKKRGCDW